MKTANNNFGGSSITKDIFQWIIENIPHGSNIIEVGSGLGSTPNLALYFNVFSIENEEQAIREIENVTFIHAPLKEYDEVNKPPYEFPNEKAWYDVESIRGKLPKQYSFILLDGPEGKYGRGGFLKNIKLFNRNAIVLIHDTNREAEKKLAEEIAHRWKKQVTFFDTYAIVK